MNVLITGHTGFKGSWLTLLLSELGHSVSGVALNPEPVSLFELAGVQNRLAFDLRADIRSPSTMKTAMTNAQPDVVIHMAAQPLVRESFVHPRLTVETNVLGTLNVLESASLSSDLQALLILTTDKVYRNTGQTGGYREDDPLGGEDPYSASKAMADLLTQSWMSSFSGPSTAVVRAGNVIGGGDFGKDRLIPDLISAITRNERVLLRYPDAIRPWQHILDCLSGYLMITKFVLGSSQSNCGVWNVGPDRGDLITVADVSSLVESTWGVAGAWDEAPGECPPESGVLTLDASKVRVELGWQGSLDFTESVRWTTHWYREVNNGASPLAVTLEQLRAYLARVEVPSLTP